MATGDDILRLARRHVGERYVMGALAPKDNARWQGPWDCAEFASWLVYQTHGVLYGCSSNQARPGLADAWTGFWKRDAESLGAIVSIADAARTPGAAVLRAAAPGAVGHIVISDGEGGTVEARSALRGVVTATLRARRWDYGILVPGIVYDMRPDFVAVADPRTVVYRLTTPYMTGSIVRQIQRALRREGFDPGPIDSTFGPGTHAAVVSYQAARRLTVDGEIGVGTARALGVALALA